MDRVLQPAALKAKTAALDNMLRCTILNLATYRKAIRRRWRAPASPPPVDTAQIYSEPTRNIICQAAQQPTLINLAHGAR